MLYWEMEQTGFLRRGSRDFEVLATLPLMVRICFLKKNYFPQVLDVIFSREGSVVKGLSVGVEKK